MTIAAEESAAASSERDAAEKVRLMEVLGADPSARTQPPHIRAQLSSLEKEQKARATRFTRDVIDRALVDLLSVYRDALVVRTGAGSALVNEDSRQVVQRVCRAARARRPAAARWTPSARPASGSAPTSTRSSRWRRWPSTCACRR